ncbi:uncharacterized protein LOC143296730 [Babylonia areolata]|uniref:uncharacterized protein LOC143296730 n=1 Tax=Babylonia areolata TaxID=304850 RepID=UPI003FD263F0
MDGVEVLAYLSSLNHITRKIAQPQTLLVKYIGNKWPEYSPEQQEELFDDLCVPNSARFDLPSVADDDSGLPSCWPTLKLPSGEKIIVDENDIWTWRDEHSGPFSWKSKSQQDLTLLDLESDNLTKSHAKHKSSETEEPSSLTLPTSRPLFLPNQGSWTQAVLDDFTTNCQEEIESAVYTVAAAFPAAESPSEEVNPAFEGSVEDLSLSATPTHVETSQPQENKSPDGVQTDQEMPIKVQMVLKEDMSTTPPPKKLSHPGLGKKDGKGLGGKLAIDSSQQQLIIHNREEEGSAFTNPAMEVEWSNFVGQSTTDPDNDDSLQSDSQTEKVPPINTLPSNPVQSPTVSEPQPMMMDRGVVQLGEESVESTPDHTTQLLKPVAESVLAEEAEKEEVVYVVDEGSGAFNVSSKLVAGPEDNENIPRSGFDFLDNW